MKTILLQAELLTPEQVTTFHEFPYVFSLMIALSAIGVLFSFLMYSNWRYNKSMLSISIKQTEATSQLATSVASVAEATRELSMEARTIQKEHLQGINEVKKDIADGFHSMETLVHERTELILDKSQ